MILLEKDVAQQFLRRDATERSKQIQAKLEIWAQDNLRVFPWRQNITSYRILIAEVLLKRTTATAVGRLFEKFIQKYPDIRTLSKAEKDELIVFLTPLGYNKGRAKILIDIALVIDEKHYGSIPKDKRELLEIPYIGEYTANAILSLAYGIPAAMVDCNVIRILERLFFKHMPAQIRLNNIQKIADILLPIGKHLRLPYIKKVLTG